MTAGSASDPAVPDQSMDADGRASHGVYLTLRSAILEGRLVPESSISQVQLAKQLGVSRTPLREALRMLQREGLVDSMPNRRARIASIRAHDLDELYGTRIMLESLGILLTVPLMSDGDFAELALAQDEMRALSETKDAEGWEVPHRRFHQLLRARSGGRLVRQALELSEHSERYRRAYLNEPRAWSAAVAEHGEIAQACRDGDASLAAERLAQHLARTALTLLVEMAPHYEPRAIRGALRFVEGHSASERNQERTDDRTRRIRAPEGL